MIHSQQARGTGEPMVRLDGLAKTFGAVEAVAGVDLAIEEGEFFSLLGPSGCGKTTLLRMIAGFEQPSRGRLLIGGADMTQVPPYGRPVNMMFQSYALFPHMSVADNVAFGLRREGRPSSEIGRRVGEMLELVQLGDFAKRKPSQLSGGQAQRVALARCLVKQPRVVLLDEPLAALDKKLRSQTQFELIRIQRQVGITFIMVTHDQEEAMTMSSRIAVMDAGRVLQVGRPQEVYEYPANRKVADFIGTANFFEGTVLDQGEGRCLIRVEGLSAPLSAEGRAAAGALVTLLVRPEKIVMERAGAVPGSNRPAEANILAGRIAAVAYHGDISLYRVALDDGRLILVTAANLRHSSTAPLAQDDAVTLSWHPADGLVLP